MGRLPLREYSTKGATPRVIRPRVGRLVARARRGPETKPECTGGVVRTLCVLSFLARVGKEEGCANKVPRGRRDHFRLCVQLFSL